MINSINNSRKVKIANFIYALGIKDIGLSRAKLICEACNNEINKYTNEIIFKLEKKNSKNFTFYKNDSTKTYNKDDFTLVETTECE